MQFVKMCTILCSTRQQIEALVKEIELTTHIKYVIDNKVAGNAERRMSKAYLDDGK